MDHFSRADKALVMEQMSHLLDNFGHNHTELPERMSSGTRQLKSAC
jgi:hypothetical protein